MSAQLFDATRQWAQQHGLVFGGDHLLPLCDQLFQLPNSPHVFASALEQASDGAWLYSGHPAFCSVETRQLQNHRNPGSTVALQRYLDYLFAADPKNIRLFRQHQAELTPYCRL